MEEFTLMRNVNVGGCGCEDECKLIESIEAGRFKRCWLRVNLS